jgi:hypothetical protein
MSNVQVTHGLSLNDARSESSILINPNNLQQIVAVSRKCKDIAAYDFTSATVYSNDGGITWHDSVDLATPGWTGLSDPALAWDDSGNVFLVGAAITNPPKIDYLGIAVYKSTDGGQTWGAPNLIYASTGDEKPWAAGDSGSTSFHGRVYAVWDDGSRMRFARTLDHGNTWIGAGTDPAGSIIANDCFFSPEINVAESGTIYIAYRGLAGNDVKIAVSVDGGDSFHLVASPATGITTLESSLLPWKPHGWPVFPEASFRVFTLPTACVFGQTVVVAWADFREGVSRIYYALSTNGGVSWTTGPSGQPLLTGALPASFQHFHPQLITDPNGVIGCAFYEFGPKPSTPLIDVIMAQSFDGGASFNHFTVTDQPWDPTIDAPFSLVDPIASFIGDYFGLDASVRGFYPLWTDTRTGIQELWTAVVPEKDCAFIINRSTLGQDEIDARRTQPRNSPGGLPVPDAFRVVVDGFAASDLGVTGPNSILNVASPSGGMIINCTGNTSFNLDYGPEVQRFTFYYNIDFPDDSAFAAATEFLTLNVTVAPTVSASAQIELIKQPDPFILHGDPAWLSVDLRVFVVRAGERKFGVTMGADASAAPGFIQQVMATITPAQFETISTDEEASKVYVYPTDGPMGSGNKVFDFALAKVHYIGLIGATNVRVFFRLFRTQTTYVPFDYPPGARYRRAPSNLHGQPIALAGIEGNEYVTLPCFATPRVDTTAQGMDQQTDDFNIQPFTSIGGPEVDRFYGCWLDINQPFKVDGVTPNNVLPVQTPAANVDGPFTDPVNPPLPVQQAILRNLHQCLIAEIAFDAVAIPVGKDPSNWDKLAQRNLAWSDVGSAQALSTFEIRPTPIGLPVGQTPDELMIDWGNTPKGSVAAIYLPAIRADDVLAMASRMYTSHRLARADDHTLRCPTGGITYVPIPPGVGVNYAGLLSVDLPAAVREGQVFDIVVRQVTNAFGRHTPPPPPPPRIAARRSARTAAAVAPADIEWRRVLGAFQLTIPVKTKDVLLVTEERELSVLRWIAEAIPHHSRWYPVFRRYLDQIAGRVQSFGGDPTQILPSPTGEGRRKREEPEREKRMAFTGKIAGLIFDRFGDFEGFLLDTEDGERKFFSREREVEELAERVWRERLRITIWTERDEPHRPLSIIVREPPAPFQR